MVAALLACVLAGGLALGQEGERGSERRGRSRQRQADENDAFAASYGKLLENNIFLRDRRPREDPTTSETTRPAPPPRPEKEWVLVGVVFEEGAFRAYFENLKGEAVKRAVVGDPIAEGALGEVFIDSVGYVTDAGVQWIEIGQDLTGEYVVIPGSTRPAVTSTPPTAQAPGQPASTPNPNTLSIEERLRQRRMQEAAGAPATQPVAPPEQPPEQVPPPEPAGSFPPEVPPARSRGGG